MRILAIRGCNLASLGGPFELDFTVAPLSETGVFAITGATGAGKSTLLDALCLALYHNTPRLEAAERVGAVPDYDKHSLTPQDTRNLLRRGCSAGHAEADFIGIDKQHWRARWEVRRARSRTDTRLQPMQASLYNIQDGVQVPGTLKEIRDAIELRVGLDFHQFRRAVLLAQNDFATLLKARKDERADLLEALTDTLSFSTLSKLAHQRAREAQEEITRLNDALQGLQGLPEQEREALNSALLQLEARLAEVDASLTRCDKEQHWHQHLQLLATDAAQVEAESSAHQHALQRDQPLGLRLQRWSRLTTLRAPLARYQQQQQLVAELNVAQQALSLQHQQAADEEAGHRAQVASQRKQLTVQQEQRGNAQAAIREARAADADIRQLLSEQTRIEQQRLLQQARARQVDHECMQATEQQRQLQAAQQQWIAWCQAHPELDTGEPGWQELARVVEQLLVAQRQMQQAQGEERLLLVKQEQLQRELDLAQSSLRHSEKDLAQCQQDVLQATALLKTLDAGALQQERQRWQQHQLLVQQARSGVQQVQRAQAQVHAIEQRIQGLTTGVQDAETSAAEAESGHARCVQARERAQIAIDQAALAVQAVRLRASLQAGQACPVCGAVDHPGAERSGDDLQQVLDELKAQHASAEQALVAAEKLRNQAHAELAGRQRELQQARKAQPDAQAEADSGLHALREVLADNTALISALSAGSESLQRALQEQLAELQTAGEKLHQREQAMSAATEQRETALRALEQASAARDKLRRELDLCQERLGPLQRQRSELGGSIRQIEQAVQALMASLRDLAGIAEATESDLLRLQEHWQQGEQLRRQSVDAEQMLQGVRSRLDSMHAQRESLQTSLQQLSSELGALQQRLLEARERRRSALAADDVDAHAQMLDLAVQQAQLHCDAAAAQAEQHTEQVAALREAQRVAEQRLTDAQARERELHQDLQAQLLAQNEAHQDLPHKLDALQEELEEIPSDLAGQHAAWQARLQRANELAIAMDTLQNKLRSWQQQALSTRTADAVADDVRQLQQQAGELRQQQADLRARLGHDDQLRERHASQLLLLDEARQRAQPWKQLDQLIGSANGQKFKEYAQQFTLEVLLDYANQHLQRLAPRYRLQTGEEPLSLLMADGDFADERRSVHSLSGGESFLVSLALALGLASLSSERVQVESLFIDEGFASLDADTLNAALEVLDRLQAEGRRVGVISHVHDLAERIGTQVHVRTVAPGRSQVEILA